MRCLWSALGCQGSASVPAFLAGPGQVLPKLAEQSGQRVDDNGYFVRSRPLKRPTCDSQHQQRRYGDCGDRAYCDYNDYRERSSADAF